MVSTYTGRYVNPFKPGPDDIIIQDIAHSLALINRFNGHTPQPVSVAQHSVYVSRVCEYNDAPKAVVLQALLHDASEAYFGDMTKWVKESPDLKGYRTKDAQLQKTIYKQFGCAPKMDPMVAAADRFMVRVEGFYMYGTAMPMFTNPKYPIPSAEELRLAGEWAPWTWRAAEQAFLQRFNELRGDVEPLLRPLPVRRRRRMN